MPGGPLFFSVREIWSVIHQLNWDDSILIDFLRVVVWEELDQGNVSMFLSITEAVLKGDLFPGLD